jgi:hypothetical protein
MSSLNDLPREYLMESYKMSKDDSLSGSGATDP